MFVLQAKPNKFSFCFKYLTKKAFGVENVLELAPSKHVYATIISLAALTFPGELLSQSQPVPLMGDTNIWRGEVPPESHLPNPIEIETYEVSELNSFDLCALAVARSIDEDLGFEIDVTDHLTITQAAPTDPWERRDAELDFLRRFDARVEYIRDRRAYDLHYVQIPVAFTRIDMENYVFEMSLPRQYSTQTFLHGEPYSGCGTRLHYGWQRSTEGQVSFDRLHCSSPAHGSEASQDIPRNYREGVYGQGHCVEFPVNDEQKAREIYQIVSNRPAIVEAICYGMRPIETRPSHTRPTAFHGDLFCYMMDARLLLDGRFMANWNSSSAFWVGTEGE